MFCTQNRKVREDPTIRQLQTLIEKKQKDHFSEATIFRLGLSNLARRHDDNEVENDTRSPSPPPKPHLNCRERRSERRSHKRESSHPEPKGKIEAVMVRALTPVLEHQDRDQDPSEPHLNSRERRIERRHRERKSSHLEPKGKAEAEMFHALNPVPEHQDRDQDPFEPQLNIRKRRRERRRREREPSHPEPKPQLNIRKRRSERCRCERESSHPEPKGKVEAVMFHALNPVSEHQDSDQDPFEPQLNIRKRRRERRCRERESSHPEPKGKVEAVMFHALTPVHEH